MQFPIDRFQQQTTPFYYYDLRILQNTLEAAKRAVEEYDNYHLHYAIKANTNPKILKQISLSGLGADCVSGGEIKAALAAGFPASSIVFAGVGKADWEIKLALEAQISCFNVESIPELYVINDLAAELRVRANIAFRITPNIDAHTNAKITTGLNENKFGIAMEDMVSAVKEAKSLPYINYMGLHFHIGSQILDCSSFAVLSERINELQDQLDAESIKTSSINVGGGLGVDYEHPDEHLIPDFKKYVNTFRQHLKLRSGQQVHFELGRSIVAQCGTLISRILYIKGGHHKKFIILDAGFTDLIRPAMYDAFHLVQNLTTTAQKVEKYDIVGPICESSDVFIKDFNMPEGKRGDLIAFRSAGAYGEIMASQYNCRPLPNSIISE
ncbi:diaminopimelate decarboxylase [Alloprevotella rava]|uniref:Diaminopimelate decarboxylase n=1 Tax=Alloprevotella rava TaxID=671218 RepID=A0A7W5YGJ5_9BACT|nr:diaminopimelate decarboxylase [Alloprevotella rava]MBB3703181.1 diaminopimelate decarboxylase [Alloprevotella rava]